MSSVSTPLIHMNECRLCPCQEGLNSLVGLMKEDKIESEIQGRMTERKRQVEGTKIGGR